MAKVEDCPGFETFGADVKAAREAKRLARKTFAHQPVPKKSQPSQNQNRSCGCKNDCNYAIVRCRPQVLHGYSIP